MDLGRENWWVRSLACRPPYGGRCGFIRSPLAGSCSEHQDISPRTEVRDCGVGLKHRDRIDRVSRRQPLSKRGDRLYAAGSFRCLHISTLDLPTWRQSACGRLRALRHYRAQMLDAAQSHIAGGSWPGHEQPLGFSNTGEAPTSLNHLGAESVTNPSSEIQTNLRSPWPTRA